MLVFVDTETTGLEVGTDHLLELGMMLVSDDLSLVVDQFQAVVRPLFLDWHNNNADWSRYFHPEAWLMHERSGLINELPSGEAAEEVSRQAVNWLTSRQATGLPMAGNNVGFDRSFLQTFMPGLVATFHYRNVDISTLKELARIWAPDVIKERNPNATHRVIGDLRDSLDELRHYRKHLLAVDGS